MQQYSQYILFVVTCKTNKISAVCTLLSSKVLMTRRNSRFKATIMQDSLSFQLSRAK